MHRVPIHTPTIKLGQFLKWARIVQTGGQAKVLIAQGFVRVNGEVERRRGRTLYPGDIVEVEGRGTYIVSVP
ncbi:MAG: RNA-binding S4 domain-containing protein [Armatimonadota bacterium]|nr:RNA-binding S4 domain-containing protein [Armatimonadota bacterium]MDR5702016.1 RNA-binding S4 domain-containing protein [Armatimonadota bacterium]